MKTFAFSLLVLVVIFGVTKLLSLQHEFETFAEYDIEDNLFFIKRDTHYDLMLMGISHARNFSLFKNHLRLEKILDQKMINIGRGGGKCGTEAEYVYLKYFFSRGNTVNTIVYIPTPPIMFSEYLAINSSIFENEPLKFGFFFQYLFSEAKNKKQQLYYYLRSKYTAHWRSIKPQPMESNDNSVTKYDSAAIQDGFRLAYPNGLDTIVFNRNKKILQKTVELCVENNVRVIFVMTPALFGQWPGNEQVFDFLWDLQASYPVEVYDYSESCTDMQLFFDHHHLNSKGVVWFTEKHLVPILKKEE
jgi:hypothetical protein